MRKQYQWIVLIVFAGVFCCTSQDNNLKACCTNAIACTPIKKKVVKTEKPVKKVVLNYGSKEKGSVYMLSADPFINND
jgi:hypothetical protein